MSVERGDDRLHERDLGVGDRRRRVTPSVARRDAAVIRTEVLDCGIRLVTEPMADVRSVTVGVWVGTGSRDEDDAQSGASHFLEHLLFKGTPTWSAADIAEAVDEVGGDMNAFTTKEYTAFYIRLLSEDLPLGLDVLGAIMTDPALRPDDIEAERQVILDEILMHADEPADLAAEQCTGGDVPRPPARPRGARHARQRRRPRRGRDPPLLRRPLPGREPGGRRRRRRRPRAAGGRGRAPLRRPIRRRVARSGRPRLPAEPDRARRPDRTGPPGGGHACPGRHSQDRWPLAVLNHVLGGGISSRLFQEVRERRGLAYSIWSERTHYDEVGTLAVNVGTAPEHAREVLALVHGELDRLGEDGITARELAVAKGHLRAETLLSLEDSGARMSRIGSSLLLHGHVLEVDEVLARVDAVTVDDVADGGRRSWPTSRGRCRWSAPSIPTHRDRNVAGHARAVIAAPLGRVWS